MHVFARVHVKARVEERAVTQSLVRVLVKDFPVVNSGKIKHGRNLRKSAKFARQMTEHVQQMIGSTIDRCASNDKIRTSFDIFRHRFLTFDITLHPFAVVCTLLW